MVCAIFKTNRLVVYQGSVSSRILLSGTCSGQPHDGYYIFIEHTTIYIKSIKKYVYAFVAFSSAWLASSGFSGRVFYVVLDVMYR